MRLRARAAALAAVAAAALPFTAAPVLAGPTADAAALRTVACRGGAHLCRAKVSLAGGASNEKVVVQLTDTDLRLVSVRPNRSYLRGAYLVSGGHFRLGGSEYVFTLNAVQSIRVGSYLFLTFREPQG